jgi:hypothetical protein
MKTSISVLFLALLLSFSAQLQAQNTGNIFATIEDVPLFYKSTPTQPYTVSGELKYQAVGKTNKTAAKTATFGREIVMDVIENAKKKVAKGKMPAFDAVIVPAKKSSVYGKLQFIKFKNGGIQDNTEATCMIYGKGKKATPVYVFCEPTKAFKEVGKVKTGVGGTMFQANQTGDEIDLVITGLLEKAQKEKIEFDALRIDLATDKKGMRNMNFSGGEATMIKFD